LIELFEMGASIMIISRIRHILKQRPDAKIYVLTSEGNRNCWDISEPIDPDRIICLSQDVWRLCSAGGNDPALN
jgi:hypothetical protein